MFEIVQVLIVKGFEVLAFDELVGLRTESPRRKERHAGKLLLESIIDAFHDGLHLLHDPRLRAEELLVAEERQLLRREENRLGGKCLLNHSRTLTIPPPTGQQESGTYRS